MQSNLIELKTENKELILILLMNIRILEGENKLNSALKLLAWPECTIRSISHETAFTVEEC